MFNLTIQQLKAAERKVYSQAGQDGVIEAIFKAIDYGDKYFVEFGARDGVELSNTANLRLNHGWTGLLMDSEPLSHIVLTAFITRSNINRILSNFCNDEVDYLSIDMDGNDYWIWEAINRSPRVVSIEYNSKFNNTESFAIKYSALHQWKGDDYYSASLLALKKLGQRKGYKLVYVVNELDAFFVREDLISPDYVEPTLDELLPQPIIAHEKVSDKEWVEIK